MTLHPFLLFPVCSCLVAWSSLHVPHPLPILSRHLVSVLIYWHDEQAARSSHQRAIGVRQRRGARVACSTSQSADGGCGWRLFVGLHSRPTLRATHPGSSGTCRARSLPQHLLKSKQAYTLDPNWTYVGPTKNWLSRLSLWRGCGYCQRHEDPLPPPVERLATRTFIYKPSTSPLAHVPTTRIATRLYP
jgi:hypothetical protein